MGDGIQSANSEDYISLKRGDEKLYHVVTDAYLLLFLPMVANMLPQLEVIPKNADGEPVPLDKIGQLIICRDDGRELKVWEDLRSPAIWRGWGIEDPRLLCRCCRTHHQNLDFSPGRVASLYTGSYYGWHNIPGLPHEKAQKIQGYHTNLGSLQVRHYVLMVS